MNKLIKLMLIGGITPLTFLPFKKANSQNIEGKFSSSITNEYVPLGYVLGKGPHKQDHFELNKKGISTFVWSDYDLGNKGMKEIDVGIKYSKKMNENLSGDFNLIYMHYPAGDDDKVARININHKGKINKRISLINFFKDKEIPNGNILEIKLLKNLLSKKGFSLDVGVFTDYLINFYKDNGFSNITPEIRIDYRGRKLDFEAYVRNQFGFIKKPKMLPPAKNQFYGGFSISKRF